MNRVMMGLGTPTMLFSGRTRRTEGRQTSENDGVRRLEALGAENPMVRFFTELVRIPSPSRVAGHPQEAAMRKNLEKVRGVVRRAFEDIGVPKSGIKTDRLGNLIIRVPGSRGYQNHQPLLLIAHTDIVPASVKDPLRPIHPQIKRMKTAEGITEFITTDGTTTLGADDKAGIAIIWDTVRALKQTGEPHVPLEIVLTPDEETENLAFVNLDTRQLKSKNAIIVDHTEPFEVITGGGGFVDIQVTLKGLKGGHSALGDVKTRLSAADILTELKEKLGNRVVQFHPQFPDIPLVSKNIYDMHLQPKASNAIPTDGFIGLSLRSLRQHLQDRELARIRRVVEALEKKIRRVEPDFRLELKIHEELPPFPEQNRTGLAKIARESAKRMGHQNVRVTPSAGATQGNLLVRKTNAYGEPFSPVIILGPLNPDAHAVTERVSWRSMMETGTWLTRIIGEFTRKHAVARG